MPLQTPDSPDFGASLAEAMSERGLNKTALARLADITPANIGRYITGMSVPKPATHRALLQALGAIEPTLVKTLLPQGAVAGATEFPLSAYSLDDLFAELQRRGIKSFALY
ncbi:helix-turn-helix domain-containing protein [Comamonas sp. MYb69]|uniref:helix-turn-helix domain-containing protein n=1 Tax=Comamonas sp. MYb69 TaxID=1848650 RepID=UPI00309DA7B8